jgi:DNA-binding CsgD family transcriptional regulator
VSRARVPDLAGKRRFDGDDALGDRGPAAVPDEGSDGDEWPEPPDGLELTMARLGDEGLALLSFPVDDTPMESLTDAERQVVAAVKVGFTNAQIAAARGTSVGTVGKQVTSIFRKLGIRSRGELANLRRRGAWRTSGGSSRH